MGVDPEVVQRALAEGSAEELDFEGTPYVRVIDDRPTAARGTVEIGGRIVPTYPSIARVFVLREGVRANLHGPFVVEEKIDGYNVRVIRHEGRLLALTRGGYVCPFTTDRLPDLARLDPLFDEDGDLVLCAEVAGPHNPYLHAKVPYVHDDVALFAFDLMRMDREHVVPFDERADLLGRHGVPRVPLLGRFSPESVDALIELARSLHVRGAEGMVMKPSGPDRPVKYVTPASNLQDVAEDASMLAELPAEFFAGRLLRLAIGLQELGLDDEASEMAHRLGAALLGDCEAAIRRFLSTGVVSQTYTVRFRHAERADALLRRLAASSVVQVQETRRQWKGNLLEVTFRKVFKHATGYLGSILSGHVVID